MAMFGKDRTKYTNVQPKATSVLQNHIRSYYVSGDPETEKRLVQYHLAWQFYRNNHWRENNEHLLSFNYIKAFIDKTNAFLAGKKGFDFNIYDIYGDVVEEQMEKAIESAVNYNWMRNRKGILAHELLQMGGITGDCFLFLSPDTQSQYIKIQVLDSRTVIPTFDKGQTDKVLGYKVIFPLSTNEQRYVQRVTEYTIGRKVTYFKKDTNLDGERFEVVTEENDLNFLPIVHIKNQPASEAWHGVSDVQDVLKINKIYNEMAEDVRSIIDYYATPTTVITGAKTSGLVRGLDQIWSGLPSDANVFNLGLGEDLSATMNFLAMLKSSMHEFGSIPENTLGKMQHVSNTSAAALQIMYQPLIEAADRKWLMYGDGIQSVNRKMMIMFVLAFPDHKLAKFFNRATVQFDQFYAQPKFTYGLPSDRLLELNEAEIELRTHIASRREIMERLGKRNIPLLETQMAEDMQVVKDWTEAENPPVAPPVSE